MQDQQKSNRIYLTTQLCDTFVGKWNGFAYYSGVTGTQKQQDNGAIYLPKSANQTKNIKPLRPVRTVILCIKLALITPNRYCVCNLIVYRNNFIIVIIYK